MRKVLYILMTAFVLLLHGCQLRPLEMPEDHVEVHVVVNVTAISNVTSNIYNEHVPVPDINIGILRVMFFDPETHNLITQAFISEKYTSEDGKEVICGDIKIAPGHYEMLCYNFDIETTKIMDEGNYNTITAYTPIVKNLNLTSRFSSTKVSENPQKIIYEPDHLLVARIEDLNILPHVDRYVIETEANTVIDTYYIQLRVANVQRAVSAMALISGLSSSNLIGPNLRSNYDPAATFFTMNKGTDIRINDDNQDVLCAVFNTFGKIPEEDSELNVTFNVQTRSGGIAEKTINLNEIFKSEDAIKKHWLLIDEIWEIPLVQGTVQGGFVPELGDWQEEKEEIEM